MPADWAGYLAARDVAAHVGPWLVWPSAAAAWAAVILTITRRENPPSGHLSPSAAVRAAFLFLWGSFGLLAWCHWRIFRTLPLDLPPIVADVVNRQLEAVAARGGAALGMVDWSRPPRFAIPFWVETEKFWFWTLVFSLVVLVEERRRHAAYNATLRILLAIQVTGMAVWSDPFSPLLPQFHGEVTRWFSGDDFSRVQYFFQIYPRMKFYYNAAYMWVHPPLLFIAYATLAATFAASIFAFRDPDPVLDRAAYDYTRIGYLLLTFGMLVGYPWAIVAWGPNWWWDPKIASSIMMWLLYSAYLHQRFNAPYRRGRELTATLGVLCFISLLFTYFMSWFFPGEHTF